MDTHRTSRKLWTKCILCQETRKVKSSEKFKCVIDVPHHPWHTLRLDLFYWKKQNFLVIVDYFPKFLVVRRIPNSTTGALIKKLGIVFSEYGRPYLFRSDNGPHYASQEFKFYLEEMRIKHRTSSQSNGLVGSMVKVSKDLIDNSAEEALVFLYKRTTYNTNIQYNSFTS